MPVTGTIMSNKENHLDAIKLSLESDSYEPIFSDVVISK